MFWAVPPGPLLARASLTSRTAQRAAPAPCLKTRKRGWAVKPLPQAPATGDLEARRPARLAASAFQRPYGDEGPH